MLKRKLLSIGAPAIGALLLGQPAAVAAAAVHWHDLRSVRVTVSAPSVPPPAGSPHTTSFLPGHGLRRAQKALNHNHISRLTTSLPADPRCAGGYTVVIRIVKHNHARVKMTGSQCGGTTSGHIGGNLPGFLKAVGITPP
jgi:hypothetical protein